MSQKELDKFTRHFVQKAVQIIVQSRLGGDRIKTDCNKNGNDWFNIAIHDIRDVKEQANKCIDTLGSEPESSATSEESSSKDKFFSLATDWRLCCEISLKTTEGESMVLEYWFVTNECGKSSHTSLPDLLKPAIFETYNRMSLMLKSLIAITRATPAYKLSSAGQSADSYVVCYRVYQSDVSFSSVLGSKEATHYSPEVKLGSLPCNGNLLTVSVCYRTDMVPCAKSGLLHNEIPKLMPVTTDHFQEMSPKDDHLNYDSIKPLVAAFASSPSNATDTLPFLPETAFSSLFITREVAPKQQNSDELLSVKSSVSRTQSETKPVTIPEKNGKQKELTTSPTGSSGDSFVFVDLKAPFASHDQHELGSFFNGPSPAFTSSAECSEDFGDISSHLADIESNVEQWDSFVDSVCCPLDEESKILT